MQKNSLPELKDKICVITGGGGVLCSSVALALANQGVKTVLINRTIETAQRAAEKIVDQTGTEAIGLSADVLDRESLERALDQIHQKLGTVSFLINGAGGNKPEATAAVEFSERKELDDPVKDFLSLDSAGFKNVCDLNILGTVLPSMVFARDMIETKHGVILNVSSMNAFRPLTKIAAYSSAKAAINNFTQWLAVHFSKVDIRVNAIAPGFFLTEQNRFLLTDEKTGEVSERGEKILSHTPMARFGSPEELQGTAVYLLSDMSRFMTGVIIPVDGGFNAFSGV